MKFTAPTTAYAALAQEQELFACPVRYGAAGNALCLNPTALDMALSSADAQALESAVALCQAELDKITRLLHMAPRTLHRRLEAEGTSYRAIVDQVRHRLALQHIRNPLLSLQEITYRRGYTDQANFRRAFTRWESVAPQLARDAAAKQSRKKTQPL